MDDVDDINPFSSDAGSPIIAANLSLDEDLSPPDTPVNAPARLSSPGPTPPAKRPLPLSSSSSRQQPPKTDFCCTRDQWLHSGDDVEILVTGAQKTSDNSKTPYIAYIIQTGHVETRRRYSEFESLRNSLVKLYPTLIIPPIPSKQPISDYAVKQAKAKEDANLISRRKRMLHTFLNRMARHPILSNEHVFHRFLQSDVSWTEVLHSPPISTLPKNILKAPAHAPTDTTSAQVYAALPNPSAAQPLRHPDARFLESEIFTDKFANHVSGPMEKVTRRVMKRWAEYSHDHADLGAAINGFSLNESGALAASLEKTGQAIDTGYLSTSALLQEMESTWAEPLHEYSQFSSIIKKLLMYRHQKHVQYEMTQDGIESKREQLQTLERNEQEAQRLEGALSGSTIRPSRSTNSGTNGSGSDENPETREQDDAEVPPYSPPPPPARRGPPAMGFLHALSYTLHGMMDVDPETARRNSITKTRETLSQLEDALQASAQDLKYASSTIQADLDRFQRQKVADLREMAISMARSHRDWCKKNLEAWEEVKRETSKIEDHPNRLPLNEPASAPVSEPTTGRPT
ncbi:PX-domain-containing protein [Sistotremastrum suecicum HHB10207 ss-3]|uniref:PX-domain-containing protein n=1 Tax=Sistotremastrum suecicum HHB10207 ss-3 TaxID=1314776 RepID=A0A166HTT4_9AGAM|nr:PX-domain-containing protein [Sistotremastrum suecicum HHB10207 ss-3]